MFVSSKIYNKLIPLLLVKDFHNNECNIVYQIFMNIDKWHRMLHFNFNIYIKDPISNFSPLPLPTFTELSKKGSFSVLTSTYRIYKRRHLKIHNRAANTISGTTNGKLYGLSNCIMCLHFYESLFMKTQGQKRKTMLILSCRKSLKLK